MEKREKVLIPRGASNEEPNVFVSVNGVNYLLPKGKTSEVPAWVAYELNRAQEAKMATYQRKDAMLAK